MELCCGKVWSCGAVMHGAVARHDALARQGMELRRAAIMKLWHGMALLRSKAWSCGMARHDAAARHGMELRRAAIMTLRRDTACCCDISMHGRAM